VKKTIDAVKHLEERNLLGKSYCTSPNRVYLATAYASAQIPILQLGTSDTLGTLAEIRGEESGDKNGCETEYQKSKNS